MNSAETDLCLTSEEFDEVASLDDLDARQQGAANPPRPRGQKHSTRRAAGAAIEHS
ncbi:hypothetical protein AB0L63_17755 [Nocardia sp. NPDC051990]|uniref:hypothetical protein n=1 Tax=Nocardia sp. NPDC051990 TaxID=3155285 RepID=UPI0034365D51